MDIDISDNPLTGKPWRPRFGLQEVAAESRCLVAACYGLLGAGRHHLDEGHVRLAGGVAACPAAAVGRGDAASCGGPGVDPGAEVGERPAVEHSVLVREEAVGFGAGGEDVCGRVLDVEQRRAQERVHDPVGQRGGRVPGGVRDGAGDGGRRDAFPRLEHEVVCGDEAAVGPQGLDGADVGGQRLRPDGGVDAADVAQQRPNTSRV